MTLRCGNYSRNYTNSGKGSAGTQLTFFTHNYELYIGRKGAKMPPRRRGAKETSDAALRREIRTAEALCQEEEEELSDADTLDSDYETETETDEGSSYESDFIDDSEADHVALNKWKHFDIRDMEDKECSKIGWVPYRMSIR